MSLQNMLIYIVLTVALSIVAHWFVRRYWWAVVISITACSLANIVHEAFLHDFQIRPVDALFWIPLMFVEGMLFALPVAALVGIPYYVIRRRIHRKSFAFFGASLSLERSSAAFWLSVLDSQATRAGCHT
jgi:hypothetical protein